MKFSSTDDQDESARGQQFAEIAVAGIRELPPVVVAVHDEREREGTGAIRIPDAAVDRRLLQIEAPELQAVLLRLASVMVANGDASTVFVLIVTSLPNSGRCLSVPDP